MQSELDVGAGGVLSGEDVVQTIEAIGDILRIDDSRGTERQRIDLRERKRD